MKYTGFLCGAFATKEGFEPQAEWQPVIMSDAERESCSNYYYPEFVDFNFGANQNSIHRYIYNIGSNVDVVVGFGASERKVSTYVDNITLYKAPFGLTLFSVRVDLDCEPNDVTAVVSRLRGVDSIALKNSAFAKLALDPVLDIYRSCALNASQCVGKGNEALYSLLVEYGNKLKLFQVATVTAEQWGGDNSDELLFELGTVAPIGSYRPDEDFSSSKSYFDTIMKEGRVSVFNNWKALSLFDTFTMLGHDVSAGNISNWIDNYFGMLYISELYVKFYLFRLNNDFRIYHKSAGKLLEQFDEFEYGCWFDNVSYNFLPRLIHRAMESGLEILPEKQRLYQMLAQQKDKREKDDDQRMNNLLFYLTLFTTFSMVWDASSLFNEMYPFETYIGSNIAGFRLVSYSLLLVILLLIVITRFRRK
jgi:hypothetical protein